MKLSRRLPSFALVFLLAGLGASCTRETAPLMAFRQVGVIEGFYGKPWSHQDRLDMIRFMGEHRLTHYYYAPKDDPLHRESWKEPYSGEALERFEELMQAAMRSGVELVFTLSPGLSIRYSSDADFLSLTEKLDTMTKLGVRHFALLFDDTPGSLQHRSDQQRFETVADAQAFLINRTRAHLIEKGLDLVVCPSTYTDAWGNYEDLRTLGSTVLRDVPFFWTGSDVVAPEIRADQALAWSEITGRRPLIWDNYPANDFAPWRVFLGPWKNRASGLGEVTTGIVSNPMNQAHLSMLPLMTLAEYAEDPEAYAPDVAVEVAAERLYGAAATRELQPFLEIYSPWVWEEHLFESLFVPANRIEVDDIEKELVRLQQALSRLHQLEKTSGRNLRALLEELDPIVAVTAARLQEIKKSAHYERQGEYLSYRSDVDIYQAEKTHRQMTIDGELGEWKAAAWRDLTTRQSQSLDSGAEAAFLQDDEWLYIAVLVKDNQLAGGSGPSIGNRDHLSLVLEPSSNDGDDQLLVYLIPPDTRVSDPYGGLIDCDSFLIKVLRSTEDLIFEPFVASLLEPESDGFSVTIASRSHKGGYVTELAIPKGDIEYQRLSLVATSGDNSGQRRSFSLARRNYPVNRATFAEVGF